jgi:hypothetical protein
MDNSKRHYITTENLIVAIDKPDEPGASKKEGIG